MTVEHLQDAIEKQPFRPFAVRLNNGSSYTFNTPRDLGAAKGYSLIFYFADNGRVVWIDRESIVEIEMK